MIPEIGQLALILALCMALVQAVFPLVGAARGNEQWMAVAVPAARAQMVFLLTAFGCLTWSFVVHDFTVAYVASHSNTALPLAYRISAVWGAHEGSLLLWALVLGFWTTAVSFMSRSVPPPMVARVLAVMGLVSIGFLLFMLLTSNPFERLFPAPPDGNDLNPLLQDPGLAIHPPMLYMGYVGFSVAFAFAIAAMLAGRLDTAWARWSRPWTNVAWMFLTVGIALGSWWAYYELGWGGWWFWDPVENASFMPWLVGTALIHSLAATEKRGALKAWTVLLAIFAFSLSLLGTFLVRSGVLTSVHAFATDPTRGVFILVFLALVIGGSLMLYAWRAPMVRSHAHFELFSRETFLLVNNVLLVVAAASILLGTLYPLVIDALGMGKISVGPPYFESVFVPLTVPLAALVGIGALMRWKRDVPGRLARNLAWAAVASLVVGVISAVWLLPHFAWGGLIGATLATWVILTAAQGVRERLAGGRSFASVPAGFYGMTTAHVGIALFVVGVTFTSVFSEERDVRLAPGESVELGGYSFQFLGTREVAGPNYSATEGWVQANRPGSAPIALAPQKRVYRVQRNPMTEAAIDAGVLRDLFVALGEPVSKDGAWTLRIYHKPFIRWIWIGALVMAIGGLVAVTDRRYRRERRAQLAADAVPAT